jgi:hypothetical protein
VFRIAIADAEEIRSRPLQKGWFVHLFSPFGGGASLVAVVARKSVAMTLNSDVAAAVEPRSGGFWATGPADYGGQGDTARQPKMGKRRHSMPGEIPKTRLQQGCGAKLYIALKSNRLIPDKTTGSINVQKAIITGA